MAVAVEQVDPAAELSTGVTVACFAVATDPRRPVDLRDVSRRLVDERAEVTAEELVGAPAGEPLRRRIGDEGEPRVGIDRPDEVRRVLDEVAVARLGLAEQLVEVGVGEGDRGLVGEALEEVEVVGQDLPGLPVRDGERPDHLAGRCAEWRAWLARSATAARC